jgi:hypothetical protein
MMSAARAVHVVMTEAVPVLIVLRRAVHVVPWAAMPLRQ